MFEFILVFISIFKIVCYFNIFNKCGEKGWKAIIPFLDIYTRFKLFYNNIEKKSKKYEFFYNCY